MGKVMKAAKGGKSMKTKLKLRMKKLMKSTKKELKVRKMSSTKRRSGKIVIVKKRPNGKVLSVKKKNYKKPPSPPPLSKVTKPVRKLNKSAKTFAEEGPEEKDQGYPQ